MTAIRTAAQGSWPMASARRCGGLAALLAAGLALETVLLAGLVLPFGLWRFPGVIAADRPLRVALGEDAGGALRFAVAVLAAFALYAAACRVALALHGRRAAAVAFGGCLLFALTLTAANPVSSHDVYHNVSDARTVWLYRDNPTVLPPGAYPDDPIAEQVPAWRSTPSIYGPVWYAGSGVVLWLAGDGLRANVIGHKLLTAAFLLATVALAMAIAGRLRPGAAVAGGVLAGWNPLLLWETAGNAHNDIVMVCFALVAVYALVRGWWRAVFPLLAVAVATKYTVLVLGPILLLWLLRRRAPRGRVAQSLALGGATLLALHLPFLTGADTLAALAREAGYAAYTPAALAQTLLWWVTRVDGTLLWHLIRPLQLVALLAIYTVLLRRLWRAEAGCDHAPVRTACWATFALLVAACGWFGPWYVVWLAPLAALLPGSRPAWVAVVFSATAMLMYVPMSWLSAAHPVIVQSAAVATAFVPPLGVIRYQREAGAPAPLTADG